MSLGRQAILDAIRDSPNLAKAATRLGVARKTLYNRMKAFGIPKGRSGRPKKRISYTRGAKRYAAGAAAVAAALGGIVLYRRKSGGTV